MRALSRSQSRWKRVTSFAETTKSTNHHQHQERNFHFTDISLLMKRPAFVTPVALPVRSTFAPVISSTSPPRRPQPPLCRAPKRVVRMIGPFFPDFSDSNLMKSEIVRKEMGNLERDYMELAKLGTRYESFDREGKHIFIDSALDVVDRFAIFLTRLKLSEEFAAQMFIKQYQVRLQEYGLTIDSLIANTKKSLEMMRAEAK